MKTKSRRYRCRHVKQLIQDRIVEKHGVTFAQAMLFVGLAAEKVSPILRAHLHEQWEAAMVEAGLPWQ